MLIYEIKISSGLYFLPLVRRPDGGHTGGLMASEDKEGTPAAAKMIPLIDSSRKKLRTMNWKVLVHTANL